MYGWSQRHEFFENLNLYVIYIIPFIGDEHYSINTYLPVFLSKRDVGVFSFTFRVFPFIKHLFFHAFLAKLHIFVFLSQEDVMFLSG